MTYRVTHSTTYDYSEPVALCHNLAHLTPRNHPRQTCLRSDLLINPDPAVISSGIDFFGNATTFFAIQEPHHKLTVMALHIIRLVPATAPAPVPQVSWEEVRDLLAQHRDTESLEACQFRFDSVYIKTTAELAAYASASFPARRPVLAAVLDLTRRIHADFRYDLQATTVTTPLSDVFAAGRGVCQDFAHLQIGCLRSLGLAARYVSGYLATTAATPGQPRLVGADASHAWLSVYCPGFGWFDVDPTNNQVPSDKHLSLAWGRDYDDVSPIRGVILGGGQHAVTVAVEVVPANEAGAEGPA
jgi:transglutaminase-like putative cysteine protease